MKKLQVTITLDMDIPEEWNLIDHPDGVPVLTVESGRYMYMSFLPMFTNGLEAESDWNSECSVNFAEKVVEMVQDEKVEMKIVVN